MSHPEMTLMTHDGPFVKRHLDDGTGRSLCRSIVGEEGRWGDIMFHDACKHCIKKRGPTTWDLYSKHWGEIHEARLQRRAARAKVSA